MSRSRLFAASGTFVLMTLVSGAVAHDIIHRDRPFPVELRPLVTEIKTGDSHLTMPATENDEAALDDDDATVP